MSKRFISGADFAAMVSQGARVLAAKADHVNALNVFPVPDGDTGTNMDLTMSAGAKELAGRSAEGLGRSAEVFSKGLLMGARGNSGVILSQLFRGFARGLGGLDEANAEQLATALQQGVNMAYKAVVKPVEGTILTVAKEAAKHAVAIARRTPDVTALMDEVHRKAGEALARTPQQLPVLKQVGVVDSGGQGLVYIYEGFLMALSGADELDPEYAPIRPAATAARPAIGAAQARLATADIRYPYDMEFVIDRRRQSASGIRFDEQLLRRSLAKDGDSVVVIADEDRIKVHVHSSKPGDVFNLALPYGELTDIHILNMRDQHRELLGAASADDAAAVAAIPVGDAERELADALPELLAGSPVQERTPQAHELAPYGMIGVAMGEGIGRIFLDNSVDVVLSGGQTMNPSTEDFVQAIESLSAAHIFLLPNNGNIILAAQQAAELSGRSVTVIETKTIPQGLAALLAFRDDETPERNAAYMRQAGEQVRSGQVTKAVRDTVLGELIISEGDYIGIEEKTIVAAAPQLQTACRDLLQRMIGDDGELLTVLTGEGSDERETAELEQWARATFPELELEIHQGGQPLYPYVFAVE
ncbi:DAK2 domain-containing protein [Paenibacillus sp. IB182496]|uniref:DAK2 domain-containing protein n=1 Tax=Paenibacillus sabuli TaxID=2772509 RepID=A0A927BSU8_9BACL|nr:DAK2 domain-containing protein [Paenibacillus sabuli]MBD2846148.1 DAK2 domain-containing protein [Paenibacillus sabuli]